MFHKYNLFVGGGKYDITGYISNWDDIISKIKRNDYDGLERTFTYKFEFVGKAYTLLKNEFESNKLKSSAAIEFSLRNNSWTYNSQFRCSLDFSSYEDDGFTIKLDGLDDTIKSKIKANGGTEYEFDVSDMAIDFEKLYYDGIEMQNHANWIIGGTPNDDNTEWTVSGYQNGAVFIPLFVENKEVSRNGQIIIGDLSSGIISSDRYNGEGGYFINSIRKVSFSLRLKMDVNFNGRIGGLVRLNKTQGGNTITNLQTWGLSGIWDILKIDTTLDIIASSSDYYYLALESTTDVTFSNIEISASWMARGPGGISIDVIYPDWLLSSLVRKITGNSDSYGYIDTSYDDRLKYTYIVAAETLRGIEATEERSGAKVYTSFNKFRDWMKSVFGYTYEVSGNNIIFRHRRAYFENTVVKEIKKLNGYTYSVNKGIIYSRVKTGYDKQTYEEVNARDEFHFSSVYSTGVTLTDTELNLVSPYRCDTYGIEILTSKRGEDTTDSSSDKDLFFVGLKRHYTSGDLYGYFTLRRDIPLTGVISPGTQFNAMFSPRASILANKELIGACTDELTFSSSEGNSDVIINGISEKETVIIQPEEKIFTSGSITLDTPEIKLPTNLRGLIEFDHQGKTITGYISEVDTSQGKNKESTFKLIEKYNY